MNTPGLISRIRDAYALLVRFASYFQSPLLLVLRLYWGWSFFQTGSGKLGDLSKTTEFFAGLGIPFPAFSATLASTTECVGGLLILVGLASRLTAVPLIIVMVVAYLTNDLEAVKTIFSNPDNFFGATPFQFLLAVVIVFAFGPGAFSLDYLIARKFAPDASAASPASQRS